MTIEGLERRAERGTPRGPANVWVGAQQELRSEEPLGGGGSTWGFRLALVTTAALLLALAGVRAESIDSDRLTPVSTTEEADGDSSRPDPILITGMTMDEAMEPWGALEDDVSRFPTGGAPNVTSTRVYASPSDPFGGPVLGIDTLEGGGFSPWATNLSADELESLTESVERDGESWGLTDPGDLIEVAQFTDDQMATLANGWQLGFADGNDRATLQAEPGGTVWIWVARLLRSGSLDEQPAVSPIQVLGNEGLLVGDEAVWVSDGFVYRLTATEVQGDVHVGRSPEPLVERLTLVDRSTWDDAVGEARRQSVGQSAQYAISLAAAAAWIIGAGLMMIRHRRLFLLIAAVGLLGFVAWWAFAPNIWFAVAQFALVFAIVIADQRSRAD